MASSSRSGFFVTPYLGAVSGIVVGVVIVVVLVLSGGWGVSADAVTASNRADGELFVKRWEAMQKGTWATTFTYTRTAQGGQTFASTGHDAQIPPDSVRIFNGQTTTVFDGQQTVCATSSSTGSGTCRPGGAVDAQQQRNATLARVRALVAGDNAAYGIRERNDGCFELQLTATGRASTQRESLPWGNAATLCFDRKSAALMSSRIERDGATDTITVTELRTSLTQDDLRALARTGTLPKAEA